MARPVRLPRCPHQFRGVAGVVFVALLGLSAPRITLAQNRLRIDSLRQAAQRQPDSARVWTLTALAWEFLQYDRDRALATNQQALALARNRHDDAQVGFCWMAVGNVYCYYKNTPEALESYRNAVGYLDKARNTKRLAQLYFNLGLLYHENLDDSARAIAAYLQAARLAEADRRWPLVSESYTNVANLLFAQREETKAGSYYQKALTTARQSQDPACLVVVINDYYANNLSWYRRKPDKALLLTTIRGLDEGVRLCRQRADVMPAQYLSTLQVNLGECYLRLGNLRRAEGLLLESLQRAAPIHYETGKAQLYSLLAEVAEQQNQPAQTEIYIRQAESCLADGSFEEQADVLEQLIGVGRRQQDWARIVGWQSRLLTARDSLAGQARHRAVSGLTIQYEVEKKETSIRGLERQTADQQQKLWLAGLVALLVAGAGGLAYRAYRLQHRLNALQQTAFDAELGQKQRVLTANTLSLERKNELLLELKQTLQTAIGQQPTVRPALKPAFSLIEKNLNLDDDFEQFRRHFEALHPAFFQTLRQHSPQPLTVTDLRYCAYLRMGLATKEMANLLNIDPNSIRVAKHRLKQKIGLPKDADLEQFIQNI
jgi:DNA-binding CsgD family transcriptional regulator